MNKIILTLLILLVQSSLLQAEYNYLEGDNYSIVSFFKNSENKNHSQSQINQIIFSKLIVFFQKIPQAKETFNSIIIFSFLLTLLLTLLVFHFFGYSIISGIIPSLIFTLVPASYLQAIGGHHFYMNFFFPLILMSLFYFKKKRSYLSAILMALAFCGQFLLNFYWGYFSIFIVLLFFAYDWITEKGKVVDKSKEMFPKYLVAFLLVVLVIGLSQYKFIWYYLSHSADQLAGVGFQRSIEDLYTYSAEWYMFFIPPITHPVFGGTVERFYEAYPPVSNLFEQTLYMGFTPLVLLLVSFFLLEKKKIEPKRLQLYYFFLAGFVLMIFLTFPPTIKVFGAELPTISYFAYKVVPMFRVYMRTQIIAMFFLAGIVAITLETLKNILSPRKYTVLAVVTFLLILFEFVPDVTKYAVDTSKQPKVYEWLKDQTEVEVIAEYPMLIPDEPGAAKYLYHQIYHQKKLVNIYSNDPQSKARLESIQNISVDSVNTLKELGADLVLVHMTDYTDANPYFNNILMPKSVEDVKGVNNGKLPEIPYNLELVTSFGDDKVFGFK